MLVAFIHGVATKDVQYADQLKAFIKEEFRKRDKDTPHFLPIFWGNFLGDIERMWNGIDKDLQGLKQIYPQSNVEDIFRYKKFREGFLSQFVGDFLAYLNPKRGTAIRKLLAQQLDDFLQEHPEETELHIIAHSLGTFILWDVLFSDRFSDNDPVYYIRAMINSLSQASPVKTDRKICLKSITTMGSPIVFLNTMLDVRLEKIKEFAETYQEEPLRWINIIHSSDIVAYPIRASLELDLPRNLDLSKKLFLRDEYVSTDANLAEKTARAVGQVDAAMALGVTDAHTEYWQCQQTARLVTDNLLSSDTQMIHKVLARLYKVPGMTNDQMQISRRTFIDNTLAELKFRDGSGMLRFCVNPLKIHHIYVFDNQTNCEYVGYVGWIHSEGLKKEIEQINQDFC